MFISLPHYMTLLHVYPYTMLPVQLKQKKPLTTTNYIFAGQEVYNIMSFANTQDICIETKDASRDTYIHNTQDTTMDTTQDTTKDITNDSYQNSTKNTLKILLKILPRMIPKETTKETKIILPRMLLL